MFTGIVSGIGRIVEVRDLGTTASFGKSLDVEVPAAWLDGVAVGDSIAMAGACMTVVSLDPARTRFTIEVSAESLAATAGLEGPGPVNLEKALRAGDRLDGHLVTGHVDGTGRVVHVGSVGESVELRVAAPLALARYIVVKGSIAVDGVSLTVNRVDDATDACEFSINLIRHTLEQTTLQHLAAGRAVNLEIDPIGRYVERMLAAAARHQSVDGAEA